MARPLKQGLNYFPLDVDIDQDDKTQLVEAIHGNTGFYVLIKLLMKIYKEGYYYPWTESEQLLFSKRVNVDINTTQAIINDCIKYGVFSSKMHNEHQILTSKGIQDRFFEACKRRKSIDIIKEYLLSDVSELVNVNIYSKNVDINPQAEEVNEYISTQSKGKETKEKENIKKPKKNRHLDAVFLTTDEYKRLVDDYTAFVVDSKIEDLDNYIGSTGKKYKDHNKTLRGWLKRDHPVTTTVKAAAEKPKEFVLNMNAGEG